MNFAMKKTYLLALLLLSLKNLNSQVVFCPPGAEWTYNFWTIFTSGGENNVKIKYIKDTLIASNTVKVLEHTGFYLDCNYSLPIRTLILQKGDTIFMRNYLTQNNWQILYNFSLQPGFSYSTTIRSSWDSQTNMVFTIVLDSLKNITVNGITLKQQYVKYFSPCNPFGHPAVITERFGSNDFMFNYCNAMSESCDNDFFKRFLCYKDSTFGTAQFTAFPCDYSNPVGLSEYTETNMNVSVFPNPGSDFVEFKADFLDYHPKIEFSALSGRVVKQVIVGKSNSIDIREMEDGLYVLRAFSQDGVLLGRGKFLKSQ